MIAIPHFAETTYLRSSPINPSDQTEPGKRLDMQAVERFVNERIFVVTPKSYYDRYPNWPGLVGLEIESLPILSTPGFPPKLAPLKSILHPALEALAAPLNWQGAYDPPASAPSETRTLMSIDLGKQDQITFEPGGQLEVSSKPFPCLGEAAARLKEVQGHLDLGLAEQGIELLQLGINPWYTPQEIGLQMDKARYRSMTAYFSSINSGIGLRMMRQTCTVQVNLDFGADEAILAKRYAASQFLAAASCASFAYSTYVDGTASPYDSYRNHIWQEIDSARTGFVPMEAILRDLDKTSCVKAYLDFILKAPVVFVSAPPYEVPSPSLSFADWLTHGWKGNYPTLEDLQTFVSLLFPEVRPRGFLELRSIDCQARPWQMVPAAYYTGLLYDAANLDRLLEMAEPYASKSALTALWSKAKYGLKDKTLAHMADRLMQLAIEGFDRLPDCFRGEGLSRNLRVFHEHFTSRALSPASALREQVAASGGQIPTVEDFRALEDSWYNLNHHLT